MPAKLSCASINADWTLLSHINRTKSQLEKTHQNAINSLNPLDNLPEELKDFPSKVVQIRNGQLFATGLCFQGQIISVGHIADQHPIGTVFLANDISCTLTKNGIDVGMGFDCAIFTPSETNLETVDAFYPLAEESVLLLMIAGQFFWRFIHVDIISATFPECTAPGYSGAIILSKNFSEGWGVSGIHVGEGRILNKETLAPFLTTSRHTSLCCFPHIPTAYDPQGLKLTPPAYIYSKTRPVKKEQLQIPDLFELEVKGWFSDPFLYGTPSNTEANFSDKRALVGRHLAYSEEQSLQIARRQLNKRGSDLLSVVDCSSLNYTTLQNYIENERFLYLKRKGQDKASSLLHESADSLGIKLFRQYRSHNGFIDLIVTCEKLDKNLWHYTHYDNKKSRLEKTFEETESPIVEVKFEEGLDRKKEAKKGKTLYLSHLKIPLLKEGF